jgi:long-chain acyl-CoA synthetase
MATPFQLHFMVPLGGAAPLDCLPTRDHPARIGDTVVGKTGFTGAKMYTGKHAYLRPLQPAFIMANSGESVTYAELEARTNRLAHLFRNHGLKRLDHYAIFMENNSRYLEACGAGERGGLYYTCVNSYLTPSELAYIVNNSESRILITSVAKLEVARQALDQCPRLELCIVADGSSESEHIVGLREATLGLAKTPIEDESIGTAMLYSSGTTGRPKGILRPLAEQSPTQQLPIFDFLHKLWQYREGMIYLSPAPLYHSAPQAAVNLAIRTGGTVIIMESFDPERYLELVEKWGVTHSQLVPTMFSRLLKLPEAARSRYDLSSLEIAIHAAAPCPAAVKDEMINWWGPIIQEYYGATEGLGFTACNSAEWLAHRGTVGRVLLGELHILDEDMKECPAGTPGTVWFKTATPFEYFNDPDRTRDARSPDGSMSTVGDVGYVDSDGFLHLTDRATFMIISGGVNIYPQECENLLITHPKIADAAVFGVPNADLGEEVKAVVQPMPGVKPGPDLAQELISFCSQSLSRQKVPRSIDFEDELPRLPTGKLYKRLLRDRYWGNKTSRIV